MVIVVSGTAITVSPAAQPNVTSSHPSTLLVPKPASLGSLRLCWSVFPEQGSLGWDARACGLAGNGWICGKPSRPTGMHCGNPALRQLPELELAPHQFPVDVTCYFSSAVFTTVELSRVIGARSGQARQLPMRERGCTFPNPPRLPSLLLPALGTPGIWGHPARRAL